MSPEEEGLWLASQERDRTATLALADYLDDAGRGDFTSMALRWMARVGRWPVLRPVPHDCRYVKRGEWWVWLAWQSNRAGPDLGLTGNHGLRKVCSLPRQVFHALHDHRGMDGGGYMALARYDEAVNWLGVRLACLRRLVDGDLKKAR